MRSLITLLLIVTLSSVMNAGRTFNVIPMKTGDKFGFVDTKGNTLIEPIYTNVSFSGSNAFLVYKDNLCGLVDSTGREVVKPMYKVIDYKGAGCWAVWDQNSVNALMNSSYKVVTEFTYKSFYFYADGLFGFQKGSLWGFMDKDGKEVIPAAYDFAGSFRFGKCKVSQYTEVDGKRVLMNSIIDKTGKKLLTTDHDIEILSATNILHVTKEGSNGGNVAYITDPSGKKTSELTCEGTLAMNCTFFEWKEGLSKFTCNGKQGFVDENLKVVIEPKYDKVNTFYSGVVAVQENSKWYYINRKGEKVFDYNYTIGYLGAPSFYSSSISVTDPATKLYGILNSSGKLVIPATYEQTKFVSNNGFFGAKQGGLWGIIDQNNKVVVPFKYDHIEETYFDWGLIRVRTGEVYYFVSSTGKEYVK